jgi:gluconolactonase
MAHQDKSERIERGTISRRTLVGAMAASTAVTGSRSVMAQAEKGTPPSVVTSPPRDFGPNAPPNVYVFDPDIVIVDPLFTQYVQGNTPIKRLWTGALWSEGPAWSAQGRYLGVTVWTPEGKLIGRIRLPENTANLCFGGPKRDRRFMAASQSLYAVYLRTQGAAPG